MLAATNSAKTIWPRSFASREQQQTRARSAHCKNSTSTSGSASHCIAPINAPSMRSSRAINWIPPISARSLRHADTVHKVGRRKLLPALGRAGKAPRFFRGAEQRLGLIDAFLLLGLRVAVGDDARTRLHVHHAVLHQSGAQDDAGVHRAIGGEIADAAGVEPALVL